MIVELDYNAYRKMRGPYFKVSINQLTQSRFQMKEVWDFLSLILKITRLLRPGQLPKPKNKDKALNGG
jgi:hypothetical protein